MPTFTPTTEPFVLATPTPAATATPVPTATPAVVVPPATALGNIRHEWQTWNNCGPATLAMNLSYYGSPLDQAQIGAVLRNVPDDKNVGPQEMADFARGQGFNAEVRVNGSPDRLRALLAAGIPVLVETWHEAEPNDGLGHYRLLTGYDDARNVWIAYDTYDNRNPVATDGTYQGVALDYGEFDNWWRVFNRTFVLVYPPDRAAGGGHHGRSLRPQCHVAHRLDCGAGDRRGHAGRSHCVVQPRLQRGGRRGLHPGRRRL
ncbi:MAG: C39 family peptidase [Caldilineaceae bacterium]